MENEEILNPDLPICDAHHHLWDRPNDRYLVREFLRDTGSGHNIVKTVFVGCKTMYRQDGPVEMRPVGETEFIERITAKNLSSQQGTIQVAAGIIGFADLTLGMAIEPVLEAHITAGKGRFLGIRMVGKWKTNPKWREGFACLGKYGLNFDAFNIGTFAEVAELAGAFPATTIILNHIGGVLGIGPFSSERDDMIAKWRHGISLLPEHPNIFIKLGGLGMASFGFGWAERTTKPNSIEIARTIAPYYLECIEKFGTKRCMFESNFPVDRISYSYNSIWNAFKLIVKDFSPDEQSDLLHNTAVRAYRLMRRL
ncbi:MAG: amidohydrolase family protein [Dehalococcoidales bacterium]